MHRPELSDVAFGNGKFIPVGRSATNRSHANVDSVTAVTITSPDGVNCTAATPDQNVGSLTTVTFRPASGWRTGDVVAAPEDNALWARHRGHRTAFHGDLYCVATCAAGCT